MASATAEETSGTPARAGEANPAIQDISSTMPKWVSIKWRIFSYIRKIMP